MLKSALVATFYVNPVVGNDTHTGTQFTPFRSLTRALRETTIPKIIKLTNGTYSTASGEVFPLYIPTGVVLIGNETTKGEGIVIMGSGKYRSPSFGVQNITMLLLGDAQLKGVTITNTTPKGTGVWIESTSPTLANNTFSHCSREGVFVSGTAKAVIIDNVFVQNAASGLVMARNSKGDVLRNVLQKNTLGIAVSDFATPMIANNKLSENRTAIALSRNARPILRHNLIANNTQTGLLIHGNASPDLGTNHDPGGNIFHESGQFDVQNFTSIKLISAGNQLSPIKINGLLEFTAVNHQVDLPVYTDILGHWAEKFIWALASMNLTHVFADCRYQPDQPITRAQYSALVAAAFNPEPRRAAPNFTDVPKDSSSYRSIQIAAQGGFVGGKSDGTFRPHQNVQRLQVIVSLVSGLELPPDQTNPLLDYSDFDTIPKSARTAVATAIRHKILVNHPDTQQIKPFEDAKRGEVAAMVYQALVAIGQTLAINSPYINSLFTD
ncbi:MAG: DUF1565 domain-containing protein [Rhizonema sp. PD37]|nr:DUF1565 domain-containing protein [Rhizonema sp. PD37]